MEVTLRIHCEDREGIISKVTGLIHKSAGNITYLDQHVDRQAGVFFMRVTADLPTGNDDKFEEEFTKGPAESYNMSWDLHRQGQRDRMAIFVSKYNHCLFDLLGRYQAGELEAEIPLIISNHPDLEPMAEQYGIPFHHIPVEAGKKDRAEARQMELLRDAEVDFIVLARYMQIVTPRLIDQYPNRIINIHHSFLPAFAGARPYHAAFERGVKIIGATSHYVTEDLDAGPIISQDVAAVSHSHTVKDLIRKGKDLERQVLSQAVGLHLARKTMVYHNKTVIFT